MRTPVSTLSPLPPPTGPPLPGPTTTRPPHRWRKFAMLGALVVLVGGAAAVLLLRGSPHAEFSAGSLDVPQAVVEGETLHVGVVIENTGGAAGTKQLTLLIDGSAVDTTTVELAAGATTTAAFSVDGLAAGDHRISLEGVPDVTGSVHVMRAPQFVIDELVVTPEQVDLTVDPTVTVSVRQSNAGEIEGSHTLELTLDGRTVDHRDTTLAGGASGVEVFTLTMDTPGHPVIGVDGTFATVWVLKPAELLIDHVIADPNPVNIAATHDVTVSVQLSNVGESPGTFPLEVSLDGQIVETRQVTMAAGESTEQQFTVNVTNPGPHGLRVNDVDVWLEANQIERPANGATLVNQLGGGSNLLTIENQQDQDVYVVLAAPGDGQPPLLGVYVHAGSTVTIHHLRSGTYTAYFVHGTDWCTYHQRFTGSADYGRFDEDAVFQSTSTTYTVITLTFGSTGVGSPTSDVNPDDFPTASS